LADLDGVEIPGINGDRGPDPGEIGDRKDIRIGLDSLTLGEILLDHLPRKGRPHLVAVEVGWSLAIARSSALGILKARSFCAASPTRISASASSFLATR